MIILGHHRQSSLNHAWHKQHVEQQPGKAMYCQLCMKCGKLPRIGSGRHECSMMHRDAQHCKHEENETHLTGVIRGVIEAGMTRERKAVIGALRSLYFLAKNEMPHTTKFATLLDVAINLGCDYMIT